MPIASALKTQKKIDFLRLMLLSREGDRREGILLRQSKGWFQVSGIGHEALVGFKEILRPEDWIFPYYRDRAIMLARGMSNYELALAYFAKRDSSSGGRQMPGHYSCAKRNVFSVPTPVGSNLLPAVGAAWAAKLEGKDSIFIASIGDAAIRQGEFYEAMAFAIQEKLAVIFLIEDNKFGISTPTEKFYPYTVGGTLSTDHMVRVDARYLDQLIDAAKHAEIKARSGQGPTIMWCDMDRLSSHTSSDDHRVYRTQEDIDIMMKRDPIDLLANRMIIQGELTQNELESIKIEIANEVDADYIKAEKAQDPLAQELYKDCLSASKAAETPPIQIQNVTMVESINQTLQKALEKESKMIMFGEDIEDPKGGVFGLTKGLSNQFPKQVFNSPLAEATIFGIAIGMSLYGYKPVFELQFIDFITPAWNQLVTNMSSLRWRSFGAWKCPLVIYAPYGAYLPGGSLWHSQSNEGSLAHIPGIQIVVPSTPEDAAGLFWTAMQAEDPTFVLIPKHLFRKRSQVENVEPIPLGKAKIICQGTDVTVVAWGNTLELVEEAVQKLGNECSVEIIDLRSIVPCDYNTIIKSLEKTGRLVVVQEDTRTCGFGQSIISEMTSKTERFNLFLSAPQLVTREDIHIGFNPIYEYAALPNIEQIIKAIQTTME